MRLASRTRGWLAALVSVLLLGAFAPAAAVAANTIQASWHGTSWSAVTLLNGKAKKSAKVSASAACAIGTCTASTTADKKGKWKLRFDAIVPAGRTSVAVTLRSGSVSKVQTLTLAAPTTSKPGNGTVMVVGDSLAVGGATYLQSAVPDRRITTQAASGRSLFTGMAIFNHTPLSSQIKVGVFSLFTNDDPRAVSKLTAQVRAAMTRLGSQRCAVWFTIRRPKLAGVSYTVANRALLALAAEPQYGGRLQIVPWWEAVDADHDLVTKDRVHPTPEGAKVRAKLTADAISRCPVL